MAWRSMVGFPESGKITGNGQFWLWWWGRNLRFDAADDVRHANWVQPSIDGEWRHVVASWDDERFRVWLDGECALDSARYNPSTTSGPMAAVLRRSTFDYFTYDRVPADVFYVGCIKDGKQMDGLIDELKIWNAPMQEEEVKALCRKEGYRPVQGKGSKSASRAATGRLPVHGSVCFQRPFGFECTDNADHSCCFSGYLHERCSLRRALRCEQRGDGCPDICDIPDYLRTEIIDYQ